MTAGIGQGAPWLKDASSQAMSFLQPPLHMSPLQWGWLPFAWQQEQKHWLGHTGLSRVFTKSYLDGPKSKSYFPSHEQSDAGQGGENPFAQMQMTSSHEPPTYSETPKPFPTTEQQCRFQNCFPKLSEKQWIHFCWFTDKYWACSSCPWIQLCYGWDNPGVTLTRKLANC